MSITIESDLKEIFEKFDRRFDKLDQKMEAIQKDVTDLRSELKQDIGDLRSELKQDIGDLKSEFKQDVNELKVESVSIKGEIKVLDTKIDGLSARLQNQEFLSRSILGGLLLIVLGGAAKMFGLFPVSP